MKETIIILDFGSQYTQLIARRVRELNVYSEIVHHKIKPDEIKKKNPSGIILSGGPASVTEKNSPSCDPNIFRMGIPVLGICYGMQLMCRILGGKVTYSKKREFGKTELNKIKDDIFLKGVPQNSTVWMSHGDIVTELPPNFITVAKSKNTPHVVIKNNILYGIQFHPEVVHTEYGKKMFENFVYKISGCKGNWTISSFIEEKSNEIKNIVKEKEKVICAVSGGVDSTVLAVFLNKIIHDNLFCVFVNNGLLRKNEADEVLKTSRKYKINLKYINSEKIFLKKLKGVIDPEKKRKIIGKLFIDVFQKETEKIGNVTYLAQGTLYPDVIESKSAFGGPSSTIKTHHNVGGLPEKMKLKLIEPFRYLFKDEVRKIGKQLSLPDEIIKRHPFPGPGLAVRIIGEVNPVRLNLLREADEIIIQEIKREKLYDKIWQAFGVLLPVKSVGVMGDERSYENTIVVRAVTSVDGMTADWFKFPYSVLEKISNRIINEVKGINRVVYDISSKPPATIEWE